ncbi:MAG: methyltransferase [Bdellovibrionota bacterium]
MKYTLLTCATLNYLSYFCCLFAIFRSHKEVHSLQFSLLKLNTLALWVSGPVLIWNSTPHAGYLFISVVQLLCLAGFWSTSRIASRNQFTTVYSKDTPVKLVRSGLYKYVRHPFYLIYLMTYGSIVFVAPSMIYSALVVSITALYIHAARTEEAKFQASVLSLEHKRYQDETGMFLPKIKKAG